jgi:hypothetical protein
MQFVVENLFVLCLFCGTRGISCSVAAVTLLADQTNGSHSSLLYQFALWKMFSRVLNGVSVVLSALAGVLFIVCAATDLGITDTYKEYPWMEGAANAEVYEYGSVHVYFGLAGFHSEFGRSDSDEKGYDGEDCSSPFCHPCRLAGGTAYVLALAAIASSFTTALFAAVSVAVSNRGLQIANIFLALISVVASSTALGVFMTRCWQAAEKHIGGEPFIPYGNDDSSAMHLKWGTGGVLALVGTILMGVVLLIQVTAAASAPPEPYAAPKDQGTAALGLQTYSTPTAPDYPLPVAYANPVPTYISSGKQIREY